MSSSESVFRHTHPHHVISIDFPKRWQDMLHAIGTAWGRSRASTPVQYAILRRGPIYDVPVIGYLGYQT